MIPQPEPPKEWCPLGQGQPLISGTEAAILKSYFEICDSRHFAVVLFAFKTSLKQPSKRRNIPFRIQGMTHRGCFGIYAPC